MADGDPLNLIYLAGVDYTSSGFQNATIRGIRHIRETLGSDNSFGPARETVDHFLAHPTVKMLVDATNDRVLAEAAVREAVDYHQGAALFEINPEDLSLPDPEVDEQGEELPGEPGPFSPAAYKTALALLSMEDGNPTRAYYRAAMLGHTTEDHALYQEVQYAIMSVFPPLSRDL